jgi:hypothetical protein
MTIKMTFSFVLAALPSVFSLLAADASADAGPVYELRIYYAAEGKLDDLNARFRNHTMKIFENHRMKNIGYFVPEGPNPERKLVYFLEHQSRDAARQSWKDFGADPAWKAVSTESEKNGRLVSKLESTFLQLTDYSPKPVIESKGGRVFELRTYITPEGKLDDLNARFRNHTLALFKKHGMENLPYWIKTPDQEDAKTTLIYLLAHKSRDAAKKSFDAFRQDPDWVKAKAESEKNGSLTVEKGVKSEFLVPTDYSPLK